MQESDILLWLSLTNGVGAVTIRRLFDHFGSWTAVWVGSEQEWRAAGVRPTAAKELCRSRIEFEPGLLRARWAAAGIRYVAQTDAEYPEALRHLYDPPTGLFVQGALPREAGESLAVVGSRQPTAYGRAVTKKLTGELAGAGLWIVSGLARGVDTVAHEAAVAAGGKTLAILGSGLLQLYPAENARLAERIVAGGGAVISEWHPLMVGKPGHFPVRNRLIAGFSQGVLVVEAGERSGSLITADSALEQGRDVYAVPGPITSPQSAGTNRLIQQGAKAVLGAGDVLEDFAGVVVQAPQSRQQELVLDEHALFLLEQLTVEGTHLDVLLQRTGWAPGVLHAWLMRLQVMGKVAALPGGRYARV
jgi:DNA processing protein